MGSAQASYEIEEIAPAALDGRINALFIARGARHWGVINRSTNEVELTDEPGENAHDLVSKAAVETVLHGGRAYLVNAEELPETVEEAVLAAIFRY